MKLLDRLDSLTNRLSMLGTATDKGRAARPDTGVNRLTETELFALWKNNGLARRYIRLIPSNALRKGLYCSVDDCDDDPLREHLERLDALNIIKQAWIWGRLYGGALVLMVVKGQDDLSKPLEQGEIIRMVAFDGTEIAANDWEYDVLNPNYNEPKSWTISPSGGTISTDVHHSRVLFFSGDKLPPSRRFERDGRHESVIQSVWEQIRNKTSSEQALSAIVQESSISVMKIGGLDEVQSGSMRDYLFARMKLLNVGKSLINMVLIDKNEDISYQARPLTGLKDIDDALKHALAAATGIPVTILFGEAPSGMNTDGKSARASFYELIGEQQQEELLPAIKRIGMVQLGIDVEVTFEPLDEPTEAERAATMKVVAEVDAIYLDRQVVSEDEVRLARFGVDARLGPMDVDSADGTDDFAGLVDEILDA